MAAIQPVPEAQVLRDCKRVLDYYKACGYLTYRRISTTGIPLETRHGKRILVANSMHGMADLLVFLSKEYGQHTLHIEVKGTTGKLSDSQKAWRDELAAVGHETYFEVRSEVELLKILRLYKIPMGIWSSAL